VGKCDPSGQDHSKEQDRGTALASSSTLTRLELKPKDAESAARYKKIVADPEGIDRLMVECFLNAYRTAPAEIWLDLDATDDPIHGHQEERFFHGYYGHYCYLSLYIFSGEHVLSVRRVWIAFSESFAAEALFVQVLRNIQASRAVPAAP